MARRKGNQNRSSGKPRMVGPTGKTGSTRVSSSNRKSNLDCIGVLCWDENGKLQIDMGKSKCTTEFARKVSDYQLSGQGLHITNLKVKKPLPTF